MRKEEARAGYLDGQADAASEAGKRVFRRQPHGPYITCAEPDEEAGPSADLLRHQSVTDSDDLCAFLPTVAQ